MKEHFDCADRFLHITNTVLILHEEVCEVDHQLCTGDLYVRDTDTLQMLHQEVFERWIVGCADGNNFADCENRPDST